jgi:hypothetical protein
LTKLPVVIYKLTKQEWERKRLSLIALAKFICTSTQTEDMPECSVEPRDRYRKMVEEVFHMDNGELRIHCLVHRLEGVRKKTPVFEFTYHHRGKCPHMRPQLMRKIL